MRLTVILVSFLLVAAPMAMAQTTAESRWRLGAAIGYGQRTNPLVQSDDIPIIVDLDIAWFGDHLFFDNGDFGLTIADNNAFTANIVARVNSDRVFFGMTDIRFVTVDAAGMPLVEAFDFEVPDRDYAVELGVEALSDGDWGQLQLSAFHDVSGTHEGYEIYIDYRYGWRKQRWYLEPSIGASFKSADLNDYYWGVRDDETNPLLPAYIADSGTNTHARLMLGYQLSKNWALSVVAEYERLNSEAAASPLVEDENVFGYFAGFSYRF
jgi:outer membrane protein